MQLGEFPHWFLLLFAVPLGLILGSFLNVVIHRLPRGENIAFPGSQCPACGEPIRAHHNIPIVGWLLLRGRARCCGVAISPRYPLVELIGGLCALAVLERVTLELPGGTSAAVAAAVFFANLALALGLVAATFIDLEHLEIPDSITFGATALGLLTVPVRPGADWLDAALGAALGFGVIYAINAVYRLLRGHDGMGLGDAKLLMVAGAWYGVSGAVFVLFAGSVQGVLVTAALLITQGKLEEPEAVVREREELAAAIEAAEGEEKAELERLRDEDLMMQEGDDSLLRGRLAFGPFLALSILELMLLGEWFRQQYLELLLGP